MLVCNNRRFPTTKAVEEWLEAHRKQITVYWLPPYSPSLNLMVRWWGHLKLTILANVVYESLEDLVAALRYGVRRLTGNRDEMGFMFDHDDVTQEAHRAAAKDICRVYLVAAALRTARSKLITRRKSSV